jgi:competence protein ComEC
LTTAISGRTNYSGKSCWILALCSLEQPAVINQVTAQAKGGINMIPVFTFFAVDKGNMTLIQFSNGINMLVDTHRSGQRPSPLAYLQSKITKLDTVVITHPHQDHITGIEEICEYYKPKSSWHCGKYFKPEPVFDDWTFYERLRKGEVSYCSSWTARPGQTIKIGNSNVRILAPQTPFLEGTVDDVNNNGIILSVETEHSRVVITGDTQIEQWEALDLSKFSGTSVFLASHHGRENGFSEKVLRAMKPQHIIISDGEPNPETDATAKYETFAPVSTTRKNSVVVGGTKAAAV